MLEHLNGTTCEMQRNLDCNKLAGVIMHVIPILSGFKSLELMESCAYMGFFMSISCIFSLRIFQVASYKRCRFPHHKENDTFEKE